MAKYIDAEAAKRVIRDLSLHGTVTATLQQQEAAIDEIPAADVEPVRHGRWEYVQNESKTRGWFECSICGGSPPYKAAGIRDTKATYCPNCGAKMDGEVTE